MPVANLGHSDDCDGIIGTYEFLKFGAVRNAFQRFWFHTVAVDADILHLIWLNETSETRTGGNAYFTRFRNAGKVDRTVQSFSIDVLHFTLYREDEGTKLVLLREISLPENLVYVAYGTCNCKLFELWKDVPGDAFTHTTIP